MPPPKHNAWTGFVERYNKLADFNIETLFIRKKEPGPPRSVFVNQDLPQDYYDAKGRVKKDHVYGTNQVVTSKYTVVTFLPRNLLEQFRRIANMYVEAFCLEIFLRLRYILSAFLQASPSFSSSQYLAQFPPVWLFCLF